jgi:hypothetical protein
MIGVRLVAGSADEVSRMTPDVVVTVNAELLPFGVLRERRAIPVGSQNPEAEKKPNDPILPEPTTLLNHIITSTPAHLVRG